MTNKEKTAIQKGIVDALPLKPHGRLLLAPRIGKTKITIDIIKRNNPKTILWVTPSAKLATEDIPEEFVTWKAKKYLKGLKTVTWKSLHKITGHYDMVIFDEEQHATLKNIASIRHGKLTFDYIVSMTGTQTKSFLKKEIYKYLNLPILYEMSINDAVDIGILSNYTIKVVFIDLGTELNIKAGNKENPFMTSEFKQYLWLDKTAELAKMQGDRTTMNKILRRMRAVYDSPSKLEVAKVMNQVLSGRKMFFCATQKQAEEISEYVFHSKTNQEDIKKFISGELNEIALVNAGGTGWTYKAIDHLVMVQTDSDRNGSTSQKIARTLLEQKNYKATIWILCLLKTQDEVWLDLALDNFDRSKVEFYKYNKTNKNIYKVE